MQVEGVVERAVSGLGYELVDFESSPRGRLLRVFIDSPQGITVDDCERVSHHLTRLFTVENVDFDRLEVSSPGLDRVLKKPADFARFAGHEVQVRLRLPMNGKRNFTGVLRGLEDGQLHLDVGGTMTQFELAQVEKARLVPKL
ncbi:MAG: ribosome maturation factor RimP [Betaproteobacteria bacterium]|nr:ribosome maturation factor RimP [Betaproteobacteria bacterium]